MRRTQIHLLDLIFRGTESGGHSGVQEMYDCPTCGDEGKFAVDRTLRVGKCWVCGELARVVDGHSVPHNDVMITPPKTHEPRPCTLPPFKDLSDEALDYLMSEKRGLTPNHHVFAHRYGLRETDTGGATTKGGDEWDKRIIIPSFQGGEVFSFVACDYTGEQEKKVLSGPNGPAEGALCYAEPGYDFIGATMPMNLSALTIVEGCWDAMKVGHLTPTVAIFGTGGKQGLADRQLAKILQHTQTGARITVLLDPDAKSKALRITRQIRAYRPNIRMLTGALVQDPCDTSYGSLRGILA